MAWPAMKSLPKVEAKGKQEPDLSPAQAKGKQEPDLSPAQKRAAFSRARTVLSGLRELNLAAKTDGNDDSPKEVQSSKTLDERLELQRWRSVEDSYLKAKRNWRKAREFVLATKQVKKQGGVMDIWLQVHRENAARRLQQVLAELLQSEELAKASASEALDMMVSLRDEAKGQLTQLPEQPKTSTKTSSGSSLANVGSFTAEAADILDKFVALQSQQDEWLKEVEAIQASLNASRRHSARLVQKIDEKSMADTVKAIREIAANIPESDPEDAEEAASEAPEEEAPEMVEEAAELPANADYKEQREALIEKCMEIQLLLRKCRQLHLSMGTLGLDLKVGVRKLQPNLRPRCPRGHLMTEATGATPEDASYQGRCFDCGTLAASPRDLTGAAPPQAAQHAPTREVVATQSVHAADYVRQVSGESSSSEAGNEAEEATVHWVCDACNYTLNLPCWLCKRCSLKHVKEELELVATRLEENLADQPRFRAAQQALDSVDKSILLEAKERLAARAPRFNARRMTETRRHRRRSSEGTGASFYSRRASLPMNLLDLTGLFLPPPVAKAEEPEAEPETTEAAALSPELKVVPGPRAKTTIEGVVAERYHGVSPDWTQEWYCRPETLAERSALATEAAAVAKRLAPFVPKAEPLKALCCREPTPATHPNKSKLMQEKVEQATLQAWKDRAENGSGTAVVPCESGRAAASPVPGAARSPSPNSQRQKACSPVEKMMPSPLGTVSHGRWRRARQAARQDQFRVAARFDVQMLQAGPAGEVGFDDVGCFHPTPPCSRASTPHSAVPKPVAEVRTVKQWLRDVTRRTSTGAKESTGGVASGRYHACSPLPGSTCEDAQKRWSEQVSSG